MTTIFAAGLVAMLGCSFSKSSKSISNSISKSVSSPFESSSESSKGDDARFREDVEDYTVAFVKAGGGDSASFQAGISKLAAKRGISDWQSNPDTWKSVGRGLGNAKVENAALEAYVHSWAGGDPSAMEWMREGHDETD